MTLITLTNDVARTSCPDIGPPVQLREWTVYRSVQCPFAQPIRFPGCNAQERIKSRFNFTCSIHTETDSVYTQYMATLAFKAPRYLESLNKKTSQYSSYKRRVLSGHEHSWLSNSIIKQATLTFFHRTKVYINNKTQPFYIRKMCVNYFEVVVGMLILW